MEYLDFELPIKELINELEKTIEIGKNTNSNAIDLIKELKAKIKIKKKEIYSNLSPWQIVQLSRHPNRPYTLDYIENLTRGNFIELHGDRNFKDDKAMVGGWGKIGNQTFMILGQQKGKNTKTRKYRNFGMANPEGYRKALRLMKMAEKFSKPVITLIDTPGAYPGVEAEARGQGEAIARNIYDMIELKVPIISFIIGEGASGGALGIGVADKIFMLENTWYSVISPESCSSILWRNWDNKELAAESLKLTPKNMLKNKLIDGIIKEPMGGAHHHPEKVYEKVYDCINNNTKSLIKTRPEKLIKDRIKKFSKMGIYSG
ncbi:MAG: acetyl-CoA carboxylase carboxyltransferase subunit alpha [Flavobacteriales bacterium TMED191]|nr:MAG: acetyl-CoA carboxylase carboxyltransferase subunit alpha [Flavobacteriales bacterium TMED191]